MGPILAEVAEGARAQRGGHRPRRGTEASLGADGALQLARLARAPPGGFLDELREVMEGAESEVYELRSTHTLALEQLAARERELSAELDVCTHRFEQWATEDSASASARPARPLGGSDDGACEHADHGGGNSAPGARTRRSSPPVLATTHGDRRVRPSCRAAERRCGCGWRRKT